MRKSSSEDDFCSGCRNLSYSLGSPYHKYLTRMIELIVVDELSSTFLSIIWSINSQENSTQSDSNRLNCCIVMLHAASVTPPPPPSTTNTVQNSSKKTQEAGILLPVSASVSAYGLALHWVWRPEFHLVQVYYGLWSHKGTFLWKWFVHWVFAFKQICCARLRTLIPLPPPPPTIRSHKR